jgi:hypothetical protein
MEEPASFLTPGFTGKRLQEKTWLFEPANVARGWLKLFPLEA